MISISAQQIDNQFNAKGNINLNSQTWICRADVRMLRVDENYAVMYGIITKSLRTGSMGLGDGDFIIISIEDGSPDILGFGGTNSEELAIYAVVNPGWLTIPVPCINGNLFVR